MDDTPASPAQCVRHVKVDSEGPSFPEHLLAEYDSVPCVVHFRTLHLHTNSSLDPAGSCCHTGPMCTPLHFDAKDTLVVVSQAESVQAVLFMPSDLPWLYTGEGRNRTSSAVPDPTSVDAHTEYPNLKRATMFSVPLRRDECLLVPAGWFYQLKSSAPCQLVEYRANPSRKARFRPTLMHQRASKTGYCSLLTQKCGKRHGNELPGHTSDEPRQKRQCKLGGAFPVPPDSCADEESKQLTNCENETLRDNAQGSKVDVAGDMCFGRLREYSQDAVKEEAGEASSAKDGLKHKHRECMWLEEGWSSELDLSCDWFSHNIATWEKVFNRLGWLKPTPCCGAIAQDQDSGRACRLDKTLQNPGGQEAESDDIPILRKGMNVLEVGVWEGNSAAWLLAHVVGRAGVLYCVDSFAGGEEHQGRGGEVLQAERRFRSNMQVAARGIGSGVGSVRLIKGLSNCALPALLSNAARVTEVLVGGESSNEEEEGLVRCTPQQGESVVAEDGTEVAAASQKLELDVVYIDGSHRSEDVLLDAVQAWLALSIGGILIFDDYQWHAQQCVHYDAGYGGALGERANRRNDSTYSSSSEHSDSNPPKHGNANADHNNGNANQEYEEKYANRQDACKRMWVGDAPFRHASCFCPGRAVDAFMSVYFREAEVLHAGYQTIVRKQPRCTDA